MPCRWHASYKLSKINASKRFILSGAIITAVPATCVLLRISGLCSAVIGSLRNSL